MGSYYWYVKIPQCRYMEYGSKDIALFVQKHMTLRAVCQNFPLVRDKPLGAPASVIRVYWLSPEGLMNSTALSCPEGTVDDDTARRVSGSSERTPREPNGGQLETDMMVHGSGDQSPSVVPSATDDFHNHWWDNIFWTSSCRNLDICGDDSRKCDTMINQVVSSLLWVSGQNQVRNELMLCQWCGTVGSCHNSMPTSSRTGF